MKWCTLNNKTIPEGFNMKSKIEEILVKNGHDQKRARQMDQDDFLSLLLDFNKEGIRFVAPGRGVVMMDTKES